MRRFSEFRRESAFTQSLYENRFIRRNNQTNGTHTPFTNRNRINNSLDIWGILLGETNLPEIHEIEGNPRNNSVFKDQKRSKLIRHYSFPSKGSKISLDHGIFNFQKVFVNVFCLYLKRICSLSSFFLRLLCYFSCTNSLTHYFKLKRYFNLVFYKASGELSFLKKEIDKQRQKIKVKRPYNLPSENTSALKRLINLDFYKINTAVLFYLLDTQFSLCSLIFFKMDLFFLVIFSLKYDFIFYILLSSEDFRFLLFYLNLKNNKIFLVFNFLIEIMQFRNFRARCFKYSLFLIFISRDLITSLEGCCEYLHLNWFFVFLHVYFHSLDIFRLQSTFIHTQMHLLFSCCTFMAWYYIYMLVSLFPLYVLFGFTSGFYLIFCYISFIAYVGGISVLISQPAFCILAGGVSCLVSYISKVSNGPITNFLEIVFLPSATMRLIRERSLNNALIWVINVFIAFLVSIYKLSRIGNHID